jgi:hypothetical protein
MKRKKIIYNKNHLVEIIDRAGDNYKLLLKKLSTLTNRTHHAVWC